VILVTPHFGRSRQRIVTPRGPRQRVAFEDDIENFHPANVRLESRSDRRNYRGVRLVRTVEARPKHANIAVIETFMIGESRSTGPGWLSERPLHRTICLDTQRRRGQSVSFVPPRFSRNVGDGFNQFNEMLQGADNE